MKFHKGWTTHIPMLVKTIENSEGSVLELGAGFFSTPLLHWLCKEHNLKLVTLENSPEYFKFAKEFQSPLHRIRLINTLNDYPIDGHWGVVFVDHDFPYEKRGQDALKFKDSADYIVLHDTQDEKVYGYDKIWKYFKYRYDWKGCTPWTSVLSNFKDLSDFAKKFS